MLIRGSTYSQVYDSFRWNVPKRYNIGVDACDKWAHEKDRIALIYEDQPGSVRKYSFSDLRSLSNQLANGLKAHGITSGDRVGILLGQCPETAISHLAVFKLGAISLPLFTLFGVDALEYRLADSGARVLITDESSMPKIIEIRDRLTDLKMVIVKGTEEFPGTLEFWKFLKKGADEFTPEETSAEDPALIIYTSGTTGPPKGVLHAHRVLLGHLPGVEFPHNFFPEPGDLFWTPADWSWIGGLMDVLFPSWSHGVPVVARRFRKFQPEDAFELLAAHGIRNSFMPPTALKMMRNVKDASHKYAYDLRSVGSGGETLGQELLDWGERVMGVTINEFYGQTEVNLVVGNCSKVMEIRPGSMGKAIPGHVVDVVDEEGVPVHSGVVGEIAVKAPDPVMFLEYWGNSQATKDKFLAEWCLTGDLARKDEDGYFWFVGRKDDVITSSGYRIGPAEIEDCILKHPSVSMVAVVGSPDELRTEVVKAFVVVKPGVQADDLLEEEIKNFVKIRLAAHEFPRKIEFMSELPVTPTGKIIRKELRRLEIERKKVLHSNR
jgi:acetyl-CoA synthetase